jgi:DNA-binding CsgD family transcriptional regulator
MKVTPAERAALEAIGRYGTTKQAAHALGKSPRTVEQQLKSARTRLGVDTTVQAVVLTIRE